MQQLRAKQLVNRAWIEKLSSIIITIDSVCYLYDTSTHFVVINGWQCQTHEDLFLTVLRIPTSKYILHCCILVFVTE
jgi:hypothetical protein